MELNIRHILVTCLVTAACVGCTPKPKSVPFDSGFDMKQVDLWRTTNHAGVEALSKNQFGVAEQDLRSAKAMAQAFGPNDVRMAGTMLNLAAAYEGQQRLGDAEREAKEALAIFEKTAGIDHPATGTALALLGKITSELGRPADAVGYYQRAVAIQDKRDPNGADARELLEQYASVLTKVGKDADARAVQARVDKLPH